MSLSSIYLMFKHGMDPVSETLKGANLILWEDKMDGLSREVNEVCF